MEYQPMQNKLEYKNALEEIIICVMINDPEAVVYVAERIRSESLSEGNQSLYNSIVELSLKDVATDLLLVKLIKQFGADRITKLKDRVLVPTLSYLITNDVLMQFKDVAYSFSIEKILQTKAEAIKSDCKGLDTLMDLQSEINELLIAEDNIRIDKSFTDKLPEILSNIENRMSGNEYSLNINSIPSLNIATGGILLSNLITVAGFTGQGKTYFVLNVMLDLAKQGIPVGFISLEQSEQEISDRLIGILGGIPSEKLRNPKRLSKDEMSRITLSNLSKNKLPFYINDRPLTEADIKQKIKYWRDRFHVKVVCIDYLGLIQSRAKFTTRERELTHYSEFLKLTAKELDVAIIVLSQLNRSGKEAPIITNLAESIGLARESDFLFTIYKPIEYGLKTDGRIKFNDSHFILRCEKNRHNKHKKQILLMMKESGEFTELATEYFSEVEDILMVNNSN